MSDDVQPLKIKGLFDSQSQYIIPIYQRNYAWGAPEIEQLIQDIYDASGEEALEGKQGEYFLGSLVVYVRGNSASVRGNENKVTFETIDGQQRHTTLSILLAYLKNEKIDQSSLNDLDLNLDFDSRPKSSRALEDLYHNEANGESEEPSIHAAYHIIDRYFKTKLINGGKLDRERFCKYLLNHVTILRVAVPSDTDLNHYFEIMNNRGEQLEKHEVLKAKFMSELGTDSQARDCFSAIWDACSDMNRYAQMGFNTDVRKAVFGDDWLAFPNGFLDVQEHFDSSVSKKDELTLREIIKQKQSRTINDDSEREKEERFDSIIDFSNFLLHVLKLTVDKNVSLDDKKLLDAFYNDNKLKVSPQEFAYNLLRFRVLFDRYVIKRDHDEKWSLLTLKNYTSTTSFSYLNSFGKEQDTTLNDKLVMIVSMFHVSNPALVYKRWLNESLKHLANLAQPNSLKVDGSKYLVNLETLSDQYLDEICGAGDQFDSDRLNIGTGVQNFVFNRLDYLLWKRLSNDESFDGVGKHTLGKHFEYFQFSFRTSVEHYFPQTDPSGAKGMEDVDRFGNLCLISPSSNSRLSNYSPADKKKFYRENNRAESLKQAIMMTYDDWGPEAPGITNIQNHEKMMIDVLRNQLELVAE